MYTINRFNNTGNWIDHAEFGLLPGERLLDKLEEILYILYEEEPFPRQWQYELSHHQTIVLSYHNLEFSAITYDETRKTFTIIEA